MRKINTNTGYSQEVAREYVNVSGEFQLITLLEDKLKYNVYFRAKESKVLK